MVSLLAIISLVTELKLCAEWEGEGSGDAGCAVRSGKVKEAVMQVVLCGVER